MGGRGKEKKVNGVGDGGKKGAENSSRGNRIKNDHERATTTGGDGWRKKSHHLWIISGTEGPQQNKKNKLPPPNQTKKTPQFSILWSRTDQGILLE